MGKGAALLAGAGFTYWVFYWMVWGLVVVTGGIVVGAIGLIAIIVWMIINIYKSYQNYEYGRIVGIIATPLSGVVTYFLYSTLAKHWVQTSLANFEPTPKGGIVEVTVGLSLCVITFFLVCCTFMTPLFLSWDHWFWWTWSSMVVSIDVIICLTLQYVSAVD